jgi:hypothetical protein
MRPAAIPAPPAPATLTMRPPTAAPPRAPIEVLGVWLTSAHCPNDSPRGCEPLRLFGVARHEPVTAAARISARGGDLRPPS